MADGKLVRVALGRLANIGDLYDAHADRFSGGSLFSATAATPSPQVLATPQLSTRTEIQLTTGRLSDALAALGVDDELKLSICLRLDQAHGSVGDFLNDFCSSSTSFNVSGCVVFNITTVVEQVDGPLLASGDPEVSSMNASIAESNIQNVSVDVDLIDNTCSGSQDSEATATHVVVGTVWGANVVVRIDRKSLTADRKLMLQELDCDLKTLAEAAGNVSQAPFLRGTAEDKYDVKIYSDVGMTIVPTNYSDACLMLKEVMNALLADSQQNQVPLAYVMMPISTQSPVYTRAAFEEIDAATSRPVVHVLDDLSLVSQRLHDLVSELENHDHCLDSNCIIEARSFKSHFDVAHSEFARKLADAVLAVRNQTVGPSILGELVDEYQKGKLSGESAKCFIAEYESIAEKMAFVDEISIEGVLYFASADSNIDDIVRQCSEVYVLFASENIKKTNRQLWTENCIVFFDVLNKEKSRFERLGKESERPTMIYVDCDFAESLAPREGIVIYRYQNGKRVCSDVAEDEATLVSMNIVECSVLKSPCTIRPKKRVPVELRCPGSKCDASARAWTCEKCREQLEFGFDDFFYCSCGKAPCISFSFRCSGMNHGNDFEKFSSLSAMNNHLTQLVPVKELNILFLGETGVGKSTWINGFANYLTFSTLDEAEISDNVCLIPSKFTMTDENYEEVEITTGSDRNEDVITGRSATQMPKSYVFRKGKYFVRIIDTPGIGDTRGIDQDKANLQNIMTHLANLDEINGICILLKPNNARLTVMFSFCIKELLTHLHRDACKNIVFCFTNARGTFYRPGDTLPALRKLLAEKENEEISIKLCKETIYCIDNEAVRFLAALKHGIKFEESERKNYATSWETSVIETNRLIDHISRLEPHKVKNTLSLNDARRLIVALSRPLAEITSTIQNNISVVEQRQKEIRESMKHKDDLSQSLYIPAIDLQTTPLSYPRTVCTSAGCVKHIKVGNVDKIDYIKHCHPSCGITGAPSNTTNCVALQQCAAMRQGGMSCNHCGCSWNVHMHITYECQQVQTKVLDTNIQQQINDKSTNIDLLQQHLKSLEGRVTELEAEKREIAEVSAKFGCFLKSNAIAPYNDALSDYLDHLIRVEKGKAGAGGETKTLDGLEKMRAMYEEEKKILDEAIQNPNSGRQLPTPDDIKRLVQRLYQLKISGPMLEKAMKVVESTSASAAMYSERRVNPYRSRRSDRVDRRARIAYQSRSVPYVVRQLRSFIGWF